MIGLVITNIDKDLDLSGNLGWKNVEQSTNLALWVFLIGPFKLKMSNLLHQLTIIRL